MTTPPSIPDAIAELRENIERLTNNKWSDIELALADRRALKLWQHLHGIERLDDLITQREKLLAVARTAQYLANEVMGSLPLMEPLARQQFGNTNYNLLVQRAQEARKALADPVVVALIKEKDRG